MRFGGHRVPPAPQQFHGVPIGYFRTRRGAVRIKIALARDGRYTWRVSRPEVIFCCFYNAFVKAHIRLKSAQAGIVIAGIYDVCVNLGNLFKLLCACLRASQFSGQRFKRSLNTQTVIYFIR